MGMNFWSFVEMAQSYKYQAMRPSLILSTSTSLSSTAALRSPFLRAYLSCRMSEAPFRPREKLIEKQKLFQNIHKHTYLKGPGDKITSVAIPAAMATTLIFMIGRGIYNMSHGIGKKE